MNRKVQSLISIKKKIEFLFMRSTGQQTEKCINMFGERMKNYWSELNEKMLIHDDRFLLTDFFLTSSFSPFRLLSLVDFRMNVYDITLSIEINFNFIFLLIWNGHTQKINICRMEIVANLGIGRIYDFNVEILVLMNCLCLRLGSCNDDRKMKLSWKVIKKKGLMW